MRLRGKRALASALVASVLAAGCLGGITDEGLAPSTIPPPATIPDAVLPSAVRMLEDAAGDAYAVPGLATPERSCATDPNLAGLCDPIKDAPRVAPGPPGLDVLAVTFQETPSYLIVDLELARVDGDFGDTLVEDGTVLDYDLCWTHPETDQVCGFGPWPHDIWMTFRRIDGHIDAEQRMWIADRGCSGACIWPIAIEFIEGEPGIIRHFVPRAMLHNTSAGVALHGAGVSLHSTGPIAPGGDFLSGPNGAVDFATSDDAFTFVLPPDRATAGDPPPRPWLDTDDDARRGDLADADIREVDLVDGPDTLTVALRMARVFDAMPDHDVDVRIALGNGFALMGGYQQRQGQVLRSAAVCADITCTRQTETPITVERTPGSPGWINLTFDRHALGTPEAGTLIVFGEAEFRVPIAPSDPSVSGFSTDERVDRTIAPPGLRLATAPGGREVAAAESGVTVEDALFDSAAVQVGEEQDLPGTGSTGPYDITFAAAHALNTEALHVTIGLRDLRTFPVPTGYDALVYALGLETHGGAFMAYFHKPSQGPAAFYCAPDTLVLVADEARSSDIVAATPIQGSVLLGRAIAVRSAGEDQDAPGSITMIVPNACLGGLGAGPVEVSRMGAVVVATRNAATGQSEFDRPAVADSVLLERSFVLDGTPAAVVPTFWQAPFGYENGWDVIGAALAAITILATIVIFYRLRRTMHRYIEEIRAIQAELHGDPTARAKALVALRRRLHRDLERHRISDSHYPIVLDRLRVRLTSARLTSLGEAFYRLPAPIALRLERLLDDGHLSDEEAAVLLPMLEEHELPKDFRTRVRDAVNRWVREDAEEVAA